MPGSRAVMAKPTVISTLVSDSFNRTDSATTMGSTDGGTLGALAWAPNSGTWGISSNTAYCPDANQSTTVVQTGVADCTVSLKWVTVFDGGCCCRSTDNNNHWLWSGTGGKLYKKVAGSFTEMASAAAGDTAGDTHAIVLNGSSITVLRNGASVASVSDSHNSTATKHGLRTTAPGARFDDFKVTVP